MPIRLPTSLTRRQSDARTTIDDWQFARPIANPLLADLQKVADKKVSASIRKGTTRLQSDAQVAFLFTGQGSQYAGMGKELYHDHPVFRQAMDQCDQVIQGTRGQSLLPIMFEVENEDTLNDTAWSQPALFALEYSLAKLWQSWGIEPSYVMGHSVGEYVAACIAGVFSLDDGLRLIAKRGELMGDLPAGGTMAVVFTDAESVQQRLEKFSSDQGSISIAAHNGPQNTTVSGDAAAVEAFLTECQADEISVQPLTVSHAFHSHLMDPMLDEFEAFAATMDFNTPQIPVISNLSGEIIDEAVFTPNYWREHIRQSVRFEPSVQTLVNEQVDVFIEIGPSPALLGMAKRCAPDAKVSLIASMRKGKSSTDSIFEAVSDLYIAGADLDWKAFDQPWNYKRVDLPSYPFDRKRYWFEPSFASTERLDDVFGLNLIHPLLGKAIKVAETTVFESRMSADSPKVLSDHVVQGSTLVPGSGFTDMGFAAAKYLFGEGNHEIHQLNFQQALFLAETPKRVQTVVSDPSGGRCPFRIYSQSIDADDPTAWELNATGTIVRGTENEPALPGNVDAESIKSRSVRQRSHEAFYEIMLERNLQYGPTFQPLDGLIQAASESIATMKLHGDVAAALPQFTIHPAIGDGAMHAARCCSAPSRRFVHAVYVSADQHCSGAIFCTLGRQHVCLRCPNVRRCVRKSRTGDC